MPDFQDPLISVSTLTKNGICKSTFSCTAVPVTKERNLCASKLLSGNLCVVYMHVSYRRADACIAAINRWHGRPGHVFQDGLKQMSNGNELTGILISSLMLGKFPFLVQLENYSDLIYPNPHRNQIIMFCTQRYLWSDGCQHKSGTRYFVTFTAYLSRKTTVYPNKSISETFQQFKDFLASEEGHTGCKLKASHTAGGE